MLEILNVNLGERSYPIYIAPDFSGLGDAMRKAGLAGKAVVVTDANVEKHYLDACAGELSSAGFDVSGFIVPPGERSKTLGTVSDIYKRLMSLRLDRNSTVAALGGGVVGDIAGFAAATYLRGINYVQVPTTLIAQADSSVGGKTGVDFDGGKNMIGAFHQPRLVYINVNTLRTLPERELKAGLAEVIKHGLISDAEFFGYIDGNLDKILGLDENVLKYVIKVNCAIKSKVVEQDEREGGLRAILNFGHTIGHAVESASDFSMLHGECVSIGIAGAFRLAAHLGTADANLVEKVERTLLKAGLPIRCAGMDADKIIEIMYYDKKIRNGKLKFVLPKGIGQVEAQAVDNEKLVKKVLDEITQPIS